MRHLASSSASCRRSVGLKLSRYDVLGSLRFGFRTLSAVRTPLQAARVMRVAGLRVHNLAVARLRRRRRKTQTPMPVGTIALAGTKDAERDRTGHRRCRRSDFADGLRSRVPDRDRQGGYPGAIRLDRFGPITATSIVHASKNGASSNPTERRSPVLLDLVPRKIRTKNSAWADPPPPRGRSRRGSTPLLGCASSADNGRKAHRTQTCS